MKQLSILLLFSAFLHACSETRPNKSTTESSERQLKIYNNQDKHLVDWLSYYQNEDTTFSLESFEFESIDTLQFMQGSVKGSFDEGYDSIYNDFIVLNTAKDQYIDFDSYQWSLDENKKPMYSPDQEINWVDINKKTVTRIGFLGPSQWVEDAFWENKSTVVLLENTDEYVLRIIKIDLNRKIATTFKFGFSLKSKPNYATKRLLKHELE